MTLPWLRERVLLGRHVALSASSAGAFVGSGTLTGSARGAVRGILLATTDDDAADNDGAGDEAYTGC